MAIVSCPDCSKKLKVADTSVGKKVKCSCGNVFVAQAPPSPSGRGVGGEGASAPVKVAAPDKVVVACTECGAKLKVATASLGKKMKCPKCASVFVASADEEVVAPPPPKKAPPRRPVDDDDDAPKPKPKAKAKPVSDDDMDDLFTFAEKDAARESDSDDPFRDDEDDVKPKSKTKPSKKADFDEDDEEVAPKWKSKKHADSDDEDDDDEPMPKSKFGKKPAKPSKSDDDDEDDKDQKPVYPRRTMLNLFVLLLLIGFVTFFALVFIGGIIPDLGLPKHKGGLVIKGQQIIVIEETEEQKKKKADEAAAENKKEAAKFEGSWLVDTAEMEGKPSEEIARGEKITITAGVVTGLQLDDAKIVIDASKDPKWIDFTADKKVTIIGIYKIDGDTLQLSTGKPKMVALGTEQKLESGLRPTQFDSKSGMLFVLKRGDGNPKPKDKEKEKEKDKEKDKEGAAKLNGSWVIESAVSNGKADEKPKGEVLTFADGKVTGMGPTTVPFTVALSKDPHWIDVTMPIGKGKTALLAGIFKFEEDKLYLCVPGPKNSADRPTSFEAKDVFVAVLRRAAKEDSKYSRVLSTNHLKQIALAVHNYHDQNKQLPPAASSGSNDATGKPLLSWRVAILPYIDEVQLFLQFDLDKPWDDPHNMKLIAKMPKIYMVPGIDAKEGMTHYRTLVGPGTALDPQKGPNGKLVSKFKLGTIPDGTSNVIMVVEANDPTIWTKPDDLPYDPKGPLPKFGVVPAGFNAAFADGSVRFVPGGVPEKVLRPYLTCDNGMPRAPLDGKEDKGNDNEKGSNDKNFDKEKEKSKNNDLDQAKIEIAKAQLRVLTLATQAYAVKNNGEFPNSLQQLVNDKPAYLESKEALHDPWKQLYQYNPDGNKNNGKQPDIWTVSPSMVMVGNWQKANIEKGKIKDEDNKKAKK